MVFDFARWAARILAVDPEECSSEHLLEASGLIDIDYIEDDIAFLMLEIDAELEASDRKATISPDDPAAASRARSGGEGTSINRADD